MANIKSQIKRNRQNERRRNRNRAVRSEIRTRSQAALDLAQSGDEEGATAALRDAQRIIDRAAAQRVLHKNSAARRKAQLARRVKARLA